MFRKSYIYWYWIITKFFKVWNKTFRIIVECSELPSELSTAGLDINSSKCLSDKLATNCSGIGENFLLEIPQIIQDVESYNINSEKLVLGTKDSLEEIPEASVSNVNFPAKAFYLFSKMEMCSSSSEARRQILGGGVRIDGEKIMDPNTSFFQFEMHLLLSCIHQSQKLSLCQLIRLWFLRFLGNILNV